MAYVDQLDKVFISEKIEMMFYGDNNHKALRSYKGEIRKAGKLWRVL